ncbi:MAG: phosphatase PAP2 family protein [Bdellovibrio sp.]|nr:phosphatase PAP2 family protein [Bdellovibrio sp.]
MLDQILQSILKLDYQIIHWINQTSASPWQDQFFPWITDLHKMPFFGWIVVPLMLLFFYRKFSRIGISLFLILLLALAFGDFMGARVKNHYDRPRPFQNAEIQITQRSPAGSKSFYSNHASNMFTFATYTSAFFPVIKIPLFALAATVSYSRMYNGVHYPSDVFAGGFMGILWGLLFSSLAKRLLPKLKFTTKEEPANESSSHRS